MQSIHTLEERAAVHHALSDEIRLGIVEELYTSDRSPGELGSRFDIPSNLLSHHLGVLETAGVIRRFVSAGDRRRRYVGLVPATLERIVPRRAHGPGPALFVCSHNSARSQIAAALWRSRTGADALSAGTRPAARVHDGAVAAAARAGLDLQGSRPRHIADVDETTTLVVTVCDQAHEELTPEPTWLHWSIPDPVPTGTPTAFDAALKQISERIDRLAGIDPERTTP